MLRSENSGLTPGKSGSRTKLHLRVVFGGQSIGWRTEQRERNENAMSKHENNQVSAETISINALLVPLSRLFERLESMTISMPDTMLNDNLWDGEKKSRLIESLMLKIPVPLFYVTTDIRENWKIVDGVQRITAISQFVLKKSFTLEKLEFLTDLNGLGIDDLPIKYRNRIKDTQFQFAVISATTPQDVPLSILERLSAEGTRKCTIQKHRA